MADLHERIAEAFGGRLVIDRELGGGGMSRVFLASDARIRRHVVVKVLPSELSADVSAERFRREIDVAARLQHPHIVPLLEVGAGDDVVCYTMPYVEGEGLRARLGREGALPVNDAIRLWREILDALSYAHARGVVHRDIKPENVLLSGKHAMVTDFGVAKAIGQATAGGGITATGVSLGTPAYMSPEQAAGDPHVDHRSDLYSAALLAWEMLTGHHPFAGLTAPQMVAAHATRALPALLEERPAVPTPLATLVEQCLAKNPADRPVSADAVLTALEAMPITDPARTLDAPRSSASSAPSGTTLGGTRAVRLTRSALVASAAIFLVGYLGFRALTRNGVQPSKEAAAAALRPEEAAADSVARRADALFRSAAVLVRPGDPADAQLRRQVRQVMESLLQRDSMLFVPSAEQLAGFMRNARIPERFIDDPDTAQAVARAAMHTVVNVDLARFGASFTVTASLVRTDRETVVANFTADAADSSSLPRVLRVVADSFGRAIRRVAPDLEVTGDGRFASPTAVRLLAEADQRNSVRDYLAAVELARAATRADSTYVDAWFRLATYLENARINRAEMLDAQARAYRLRNRTTELIAAYIASTYFARTEQLDAAVAAADSVNAIVARRSLRANPDVWAGLVRNRQGEFALAERHFRRAISMNRSGLPGLSSSNLVATLMAQGKVATADSMIRVIEARDSDGAILRRARELRAMALHDYGTIVALSQADLTSADRPEYAKAFSLLRLSGARFATGRPREADSLGASGEATMARLGDPGSAFRNALTRAVQLFVLTGDSATARRIVSEAERRYAPATLRFMDRWHAEQAVARSALGDVAGARQMLEQWQREVPQEYRRVDARRVAEARGEIALAEGRPAEALAHFRTRGVGFCARCDQINLARAFDALRQPDSAIVYFERFVATPGSDRLGQEITWRPYTFKRLGELHEQQGNRAKALENYGAFVALWKDAEPEQQRVVAEVKEHIARLRRMAG